MHCPGLGVNRFLNTFTIRIRARVSPGLFFYPQEPFMNTLITQQYIRRLILRFATLDSLLDEIDPDKIVSVLSRIEDIITKLEVCSSHIGNDRSIFLQSCLHPDRCLHNYANRDNPRKQLRNCLAIGLDAMESGQLQCIELVDRLCIELEEATSETFASA